MAFTPAHVAKVRSPNRFDCLNPSELVRIRKLYLERRYKQCIAACDENLGTELHPVHGAFLLFQQAISYEALGFAAHSYSRNKIPFLVSAEDKFRESLDALPQPFAIDENGQCPTPTPSSPVATFAEEELSQDEGLAFGTPNPGTGTPTEYLSSDSSSECSSHSASAYSIAYSVPHFDRYSPRNDLLAAPRGIPRTVTFPDVDKQDETRESDSEEDAVEPKAIKTEREPKLLSRLSASLSSNHDIADALVPSPLFSRSKKTATIPFPSLDVKTEATSSHGLHRPPPTQYTNGVDHNLLPIRKTAIGTLVSKFQDALPSHNNAISPHTPVTIYTDASIPPSTASTPINLATPITLRFNLIRSIFTPTSSNPHLAAYLSSRSLARYNAALASFRTSILCAIGSTEVAITLARKIQDQHAEEKRRMFLASSKDTSKRLASYWLLSIPTPQPRGVTRVAGPSDHGTGTGGRNTGSGLQSRTWGGKGVQGQQQDETDAAVQKKRKERIEKLRADGFRVRKEKFGWKGREYYEELRRNAERDLTVS